MDHSSFRELAAGAVLDDLDPAERTRLDDHLADCRECGLIADQLHDVVWDLALLSPEMAPPQSLHGAVFDALHASATGAADDAAAESGAARSAGGAGAPIPIRASRRDGARSAPLSTRRWTRLAPLALAAVLGVVAVGLAGRVAQLSQENAAAVAAAEEAQAQVAAREGAMAVLVSPDHETATLAPEALAPEAKAVAIFEPGTTASYVMVADLPPTPAGYVYQLWYADAAGVHPLGTYHHAGGTAFVAPFGVDLATGDAAMITLEPDGGAVGDPGPQVVFGTL